MTKEKIGRQKTVDKKREKQDRKTSNFGPSNYRLMKILVTVLFWPTDIFVVFSIYFPTVDLPPIIYACPVPLTINTAHPHTHESYHR